MTTDVAAWNERFAHGEAEAILAFALAELGERLVIASSFSVEDVALIHMARELSPAVRVLTLDTGRLPEETYHVLERVRHRYGLDVEVLFPEARAVEELLSKKGPLSFYDSVENRKECCRIRKVEPLRRALAGASAWATGLRREQSVTRQELQPFEIDEQHGGIVKVSPLFLWSAERVWSFVREHDVPYNKLHDRGYPSIGCAPCTRAVDDGEDVRAGRWWWESESSKECGLHPLTGTKRKGEP